MKVFHKKFTEGLQERKQEAIEVLVNGEAENMQEYGYRCGYLEGIKAMEFVFNDLWEQYIKQDEE